MLIGRLSQFQRLLFTCTKCQLSQPTALLNGLHRSCSNGMIERTMAFNTWRISKRLTNLLLLVLLNPKNNDSWSAAFVPTNPPKNNHKKVLLNPKNNDSWSAAFVPTNPPKNNHKTNRQREFLSSLQVQKQLRPVASCLSSSINNINNDHPPSTTASDDRRNESLEQGRHPLFSLNLNLDSMAQAGAGSRAQELLRRIHALYTEGYYEVSPDIVSYNSVLKAWKEDEKPEAALELLETMIRDERAEERQSAMTGSETTSNIRVDVISFNTVIAAFANQGNHQKALELLRKMEKKKSQDDSGSDDDKDEFEDYFYPNPDTITYNIVLYSLAQSNDLGTANQAENLLREMMMRKERTGKSVVDTTSFNTVLLAWSREGEKDSRANPATNNGNAAKRKIPRRPVSTQMAAQRAQGLLTIMEELYEAGNVNVRPDAYSYTTTIQCWAKCSNTKKSSETSSPEKAQGILNRMIERGIQPNKLTYTVLINAFSKAGQPERAEYVLQQMTSRSEHQPDTVVFSSIIDAWARVSGENPEAASRALQILETMKRNAKQGIGPTATTYTSVLSALAKSRTRDACDQALDLLQDMEKDYAASVALESVPTSRDSEVDDPKRDRWSLRPSTIHYNCVLDAYARSSRSDKAIQAEKLMKVMESHSRLDCRPDSISYNSLMMACAHATGNQRLRQHSFDIAFRTFKILVSSSNGGKQIDELLQHKPIHELYPTSSTFANFFRACRKLLLPTSKRRRSILTRSLTICRNLGLLNQYVVNQVQLACQTESDWEEIAGELADYVGWKEDFRRCSKNVPREWTSKARR